jgi:hypothetical protein
MTRAILSRSAPPVEVVERTDTQIAYRLSPRAPLIWADVADVLEWI